MVKTVVSMAYSRRKTSDIKGVDGTPLPPKIGDYPAHPVILGFSSLGLWQVVAMRDFEKATRVLDALKAAEDQPAQLALPILNGLVGLVQGSGEQPLEVEEARSGAFMAICEVGKALHRGQPADQLWSAAIGATERWMSLTK